MKKPLKGYSRNGTWYNFPLITKKDMKDFEKEIRKLEEDENEETSK